MRFFDTHCHLDFDFLSENLSDTIDQLERHNVERVLIPAVGKRNWDVVSELSEKSEGFFFALGLHPYFVKEHQFSDLELLRNLVEKANKSKSSNLVALGEMGLDKSCPDLDKQLKLFQAQLELAECYQLPAILHVRKAHELVLPLLKRYRLRGGVLHAFSGSIDLLVAYYKLGFKVGVGPVITWATSTKTRKAIAHAPLDSIVIETDSPDMYIHGGSKGKGHPKDIVRVFESLCSIRAEKPEMLANELCKNSNALFFNKIDF